MNRASKLIAAAALASLSAVPAHALISEGVEYTATFSSFVALAGANDQYTLTITIDADQNTFGAYSLQALSFYATSQPSSEISVMTNGTGGTGAWGLAESGGLPNGAANDCSGSGNGWCWDTTSVSAALVSSPMTFTFTVVAPDGSFLTGIGPHLKVSWFDDAEGTPLRGHHLSTYVAPPIPEPSTYALMLAGLGAVGFMARRRRKS
jgi:PEP-CTERM motif